MLEYYIVHLPVQLGKEFVYSFDKSLQCGIRVIVSFNGKIMVGICGQRLTDDPQPGIRYRKILEIIDEEPVFSVEMMQLAYWMADYYHLSVGKMLFGMIPSIMIPEISNNIRIISSEYDPKFKELMDLLSEDEWKSMAELIKAKPKYPMFKAVEEAESLNIIEVKRRYKDKVKPKTQNYLELCDCPKPPLTEKQSQAYNLILAASKPLAMKDVCDDISYSVLQALVKKQLIRIVPRLVPNRSLLLPDKAEKKEINLTEEQLEVLGDLHKCVGSFHRHLLYGITGSGKTEIYIALIKEYLRIDKSVIFLIPEIALTPQMVERFYGAFGQELAIMHSQLSDRERYEEWIKIARGKCKIVIGARSAIFAPLPHLGLIIVDEEHEGSYKQDQSPRYHGRDVAIVRAKLCGAQILLGSATPSLESWANTQKGVYRLHTLKRRPLKSVLPTVEVVNMRDEDEKDILSYQLKIAIDETLEKKEQVILFQNRRGYSSFVQCMKCGELLKCPHCEISMYYHRDREELHCHYCGIKVPVPRRCNKCGSYSFSYGAPGTQKIEQLLKVLYPTARILRMDSDSAAKKDMYRYMHHSMKNRDVDILLGTQMISKGLDFPGVSLVGVISADISLNVPDFRAAERTFQLLTQVAGRSGRADIAGRVLIQTYNVDHYAITHGAAQDFPAFAEEELSYRRRLYYPPYYRLGRIVFQAADKDVLYSELEKLEVLKTALMNHYPPPAIFVLGPAPAPNSKINKLFRQHLVIKAASPVILNAAIKLLLRAMDLHSSIGIQIDIDPLIMM